MMKSFRRWRWRAIVTPRAFRAYLAGEGLKKLNLGSGRHELDGWLNTDIRRRAPGVVHLDVRKRFPFDDETFDYVFTEHTIEHVAFEEGEFMLRECHRVLKPDGKVRVSTPDLDRMLGLWQRRNDRMPREYSRWVIDSFLPDLARRGMYHPVHVINNVFQNWDHKFLYNADLLRATLEQAGFVDIQRTGHGESDDPELRGIEAHGVIVGDEDMARYETMAMDGRKPGL